MERLAEALLAPHRSYFEPLWPLIQEHHVHALVHVTGGGFDDSGPAARPDERLGDLEEEVVTIFEGHRLLSDDALPSSEPKKVAAAATTSSDRDGRSRRRRS